MTPKEPLKANCTTAYSIIILFFFLSLSSGAVKGENITTPGKKDNPAADTVFAEPDKPLYLGYQIALGTVAYTFNSDLTELHNLRVNNYGATLGAVAGNKFGKLKANAGLYYADASLPYSFDLYTGALSANVYLLRLRNPRYHSIEPYFITRLSQQYIRYYGNYLDGNVTRNYSTSEEQYLGRGATTQIDAGLGAEYQLESEHGDFIHLFIEVTCGAPVATQSTREAFDRTRITNPVSLSIGISFGKVRQRAE